MSSEPLLFAEYEPLLPRAGYDGPLPKDFPVSNTQARVAYIFLIITPIVQAVAALAFLARVYTRTHPTWRFAIDDYLIALAFILMTVMFSLQYAALSWARHGRHPATRSVDDYTRSVKLATIAIPFWGWATGLAKISIALMLLRFQQARSWRAFMYSMVALNVLLIGFTGIANFFQCIPYAALWDFKGEYEGRKKCWDYQAGAAMLYAACACNVVSDIVFSLMPLTFLGKIRRPVREKAVIGGLMSLGLLAAVCSLGRLITAAQKKKKKDATATVMLVGLFTCLEVQTSLIAACIPTLRSSSKRLLVRIGFWSDKSSEEYPQYGPGSSMSCGRKKAPARVLELNEAEIAKPNASTSKAWSRTRATEEDGEEVEQLIMDPVTGRIVPAGSLKEHSSSSSVNIEWVRESETTIEDNRELQRDIGVAR